MAASAAAALYSLGRAAADRSRGGGVAAVFADRRSARFHWRQRTWVPAMVPWRATEEGYVTEDVIDWYERFARGMPGAIVVEATGIRDVPSGPLLRIGHDRFLPGLAPPGRSGAAAPARGARASSSSSSISSPSAAGPSRRNSSSAFLPSPTGIARAGRPGAAGCRGPRRRLRAMSDDELAARADRSRAARRSNSAIASASPTCSMRTFATCREVLPGLFADAAGARRAGGLRRRRAALRARLHDGLVPLAHQHARRRLRRLAREPRCAFRSKYSPQCAPGRHGTCGRLPVPRRRMHRWRQRLSMTRCISASPSRAPAWIFFRPRAAANSMTPSSPPVGAAAYPYTGPQRLRVHAAVHLRRARAVRPQRGADRGDPQRRPRCRQRRAGGLDRRHPQFRDGRGLSRARRMRHRRRCAPIARRSGLVPKNFRSASAARFGCANTPITARGSTRSTSRSPASSGTSCLRRTANGATPDGKRRLTAPAWHAPDRRS